MATRWHFTAIAAEAGKNVGEHDFDVKRLEMHIHDLRLAADLSAAGSWADNERSTNVGR
jgi:hypothetical protein